MLGPMPMIVSTLLLAAGCQGDLALVERQQETIAEQEKIISDMKSTMDEQGDVIVEQIEMMSEMQTTIEKQRDVLKEASATLRSCTERL